MAICDQCLRELPKGALFCPRCGDPVTAADEREDVEGDSSGLSFRLEFGDAPRQPEAGREFRFQKKGTIGCALAWLVPAAVALALAAAL